MGMQITALLFMNMLMGSVTGSPVDLRRLPALLMRNKWVKAGVIITH